MNSNIDRFNLFLFSIFIIIFSNWLLNIHSDLDILGIYLWIFFPIFYLLFLPIIKIGVSNINSKLFNSIIIISSFIFSSYYLIDYLKTFKITDSGMNWSKITIELDKLYINISEEIYLINLKNYEMKIYTGNYDNIIFNKLQILELNKGFNNEVINNFILKFDKFGANYYKYEDLLFFVYPTFSNRHYFIWPIIYKENYGKFFSLYVLNMKTLEIHNLKSFDRKAQIVGG